MWWTNLWQAALELGWVQWAAFLTGLMYVWLIAKEDARGWLWGVVSCSLWAYASYAFFMLYIDALLQLFYVGMGIYGWWKWRSATAAANAADTLPITRLTLREHVLIILSGLVLTLIIGYFFDTYTPAAATYLDAFVTVFSIFTTFMLTQKKIDNWWYWIVIDSVSVYLFWSRGGYLFVILFILYIIVSVRGWLHWRALLRPA